MEKTLKTLLDISKTFKLFHSSSVLQWNLPKYPQLDVEYICNPQNAESIEKNITNRKGVGNIKLINELKTKLDNTNHTSKSYEEIKKKFYDELFHIPNTTHPEVYRYGEEPKIVKVVNEKKKFSFQLKEFHEISKRLNFVRTEQLGNVSGNRSYYVLGELAELEQALVNYFLNGLIKDGFQLISVPDILPRNVIESCGMATRGDRSQVYSLDPNHHERDLCLSGTSEMALAGFLNNETFPEDNLPMKLVAVSRCYRAETSSIAEERGIYRYLPAGRVDKGENLITACKREVLEETGLNIECTTLLLVETAGGNWMRFVLTGKVIGGNLKTPAQADGESLQAKWIKNLKELELRAHDVLHIIDKAKSYKDARKVNDVSWFLDQLPALRSYDKQLLRLVIVIKKKSTNHVHILLSERTSWHLPTCEIHPSKSLHSTLRRFMVDLFGAEVAAHRPCGLLSIEHDPSDGKDGVCLTLLVAFRLPLEEVPIIGKCVWHEIPKDLGDKLLNKVALKNATFPLHVIK